MTNLLTFCMIVKNEERDLPRCLDSVRDLAGELIVVDTGSSDRTASITADFGAKVVPFNFTSVDFAAARNYGLAQARGQWILTLDADETLHAESKSEIKALVELNENAGYYLQRLNFAGAEAPFTDHVVRLFPNRLEYRYRGRVHETIDASILAAGGRLRKTGIRIDHKFSADPEARRRKNLGYIEILNEEIAADPTDESRLYFLAAEYHQLKMFDQATRVAERLVRVSPGSADAHLFAGVYHLLYQSDADRARLDFTRALELRPGDEEALHFLKQIDQQQAAAQTTISV